MTSPLLSVLGANVFAGEGAHRKTIVRDVDFTIRPGETLGVVGESGSGKSMLMKAVLGLLPTGTSAAGEFTFDGQRIDNLDERRFRRLRGRRLSLLLQDPFTILNPLQTVGSTLAESLRPDTRLSRAQTRDEVERRLREVGINPDVASKRPFQLSGGMRQRAAVAAALAGNPDLLIADEPTTALDVQTQDEVLQLLGRLQAKRNMALVLITHDLRVAFETCDRIMVLYAGSVLEQGPARDLKLNPQHPYTAALMAAEPSVERWMPELMALPGSVPTSDAVKNSCAFATRCAWVEHACTTRVPELLSDGAERTTRCRRIDEIAVELINNVPPEAAGARPPRDEEFAQSPLLAIRDLEKTFHTDALIGGRQSHVALRGVSFDVADGEVVGLVGESGSGKTTIARSILGLSTPDSGSIKLGNTELRNFRKLTRAEKKTVRTQIQVVFQNPYASLNPSLTIAQTLGEAIRARGVTDDADSEIRAALERVSLPPSYAERLPSGLSGGERQRVSIARAISLRPKLLICDEPVAALDVSVQAQVLELLRSLHAETGMAMLFITHDLAVVRQMTQKVIVLDSGEIVESGPTDAVLDSPSHDYTRALMAAIPGHRPPVSSDTRL